VRQHPPLLRHEPVPITLTVVKRIQHTTKAKLIVTPRAAEELKATMHEYTKACNYLAELAHRECLRRRYDLHHAAYADLRKQTRLPAQLCITAIAKVSEQLTREPTKLHRFKQLATIRYDERVMTFRDDFQTAALTVAPKGRVTGDLQMPAAMRRVLRESKIGSADLIFRGGEFYLHITTSREAPETDLPRGSLGVDLGVKRLAVTSDRQFVAAKSARHKKACFQKTRSGLQANGSKSAKRVLKRLSGRERRFMTDVNHQISKRIVAAAKARGQRIVLEDLTGIRGRANRGVVKHLHGWSFAQLRAFVDYKALAAGVEVVTVDPRYTSQACSRCLHLGSRPNQSSFRCGHCGLRLNADLNGARNVALRHDLVATGRYFCEVSQPAQSCRPRDEQQAVAF